MKKIIFSVCFWLFVIDSSATTVDLSNFCKIYACDQSMENPYILEGQKINVNITLKEIEENFDTDSSYSMIQNSWSCRATQKQEEGEHRSVNCEYLGSWAGCDIIFCSETGQGGGHHTTSSIGMYSMKNNQMYTKKIIFAGCEAEDSVFSPAL